MCNYNSFYSWLLVAYEVPSFDGKELDAKQVVPSFVA